MRSEVDVAGRQVRIEQDHAQCGCDLEFGEHRRRRVGGERHDQMIAGVPHGDAEFGAGRRQQDHPPRGVGIAGACQRDHWFTGDQRTQRRQHLVHGRGCGEQVLVVALDRAERVGDQIAERDVVDARGWVDAEQRAQEVAGRAEPGERVGDGTVDEVVGGVERGVGRRQIDEVVVTRGAAGGHVDVVQGEGELGPEVVVEPETDVHRTELGRAGVEETRGAHGGVGADQRLDADLRDRFQGPGSRVELEQVEAAADGDARPGRVVDLGPGDEDRVPAGPRVDAQADQDRHVAEHEAHGFTVEVGVPADQAGELAEPRDAGVGRTEHLLDPVHERDRADGRKIGEGERGDVLHLAQPEDAGEAGDVAERVVVQVERGCLRPHQAHDELEDVGTDRGEIVDVEGLRGRGRSRPGPADRRDRARTRRSRCRPSARRRARGPRRGGRLPALEPPS